MSEQTQEGPAAEVGSGGAGDQPGSGMEPQEGPEEPGRGRQQRWEAQWQHFLQALQAPSHSAWGSPQGSEDAPWEDAKAFLASFEQVALACGWPQGEWVARLRPALNRDAQQAFGLLAAGDQEDYGKVKAAILRGQALRREAQRQHFRQFCCPPELGEPRRLYGRLQELCCQWLRPERHTKEQILELLVLEQFLASLPGEVQSWVRAGGPDSGAQAVALLEECLASRREADTRTWQDPMEEWSVGPLEVREEPLAVVQGEVPEELRFRGTQQNIDTEVAVPDFRTASPTLLLPPEHLDMVEDELSKVSCVQVEQVMNPGKTGGTLHMVEQAPMQSSQWITVWNVLQGDENVVSLDDKRTQLKMKNSQLAGNDPEVTPKGGQGETQKQVLVTTEMQDERCKSNIIYGTKLDRGCQKSSELTEGLGAASTNPSSVVIEGGKASLSTYDQRCCPKLDEHHISQMEVKNYDCLQYAVRVRSNLLAKHQKIDPGEETYKCTACGKSFSHRSALLRHGRLHIGEKPHRCPECGKGFRQRSQVLVHQKVHTGEKPHRCPDCGKHFLRKYHLLRHQMVHTGEKPYRCPECGKNFTRRYHLSSHEKIHTKRNLRGVLCVGKA